MKLLLENWRRQCGEYDFDILCENFDRGLITEIELYETWDRQVMVEMQTAEMLMKGVNFIKKFCNAHPILCKIALILIIILAISAAMAMMASSASAAVKTQEFGTLNDKGVSALKGAIGAIVEGKESDPAVQREAIKALEWLDKAHQATEQVDLTTATTEGTELLRKASATIKVAAEKLQETGESQTFINGLVDLGERVRIITQKQLTVRGVSVSRFVSSAPLPKP